MTDDSMVRLTGDVELRRRLTNPTWASKPTGEFLRKWREFLKEEAVKRAPRFSGGLAGAIQATQDTSKFPLWARVFVNHPAAEPQEYGTGTLSDSPRSSHRPHYPPARALESWAAAKGLNAYAVARAIGQRGGLRPRRYMRDAEEAADERLPSWLAELAREMEKAADAGV